MRIFKFNLPRIKPKILAQKRSKFFLRQPIVLFSLKIFLGMFLGYFTFQFFTGKVPSLIFTIGDFRLHFHHWLYSSLILVLNLRYNFLPFFPFSLGFLSGAIFHGIYSYSDWYKILI